LALNENHRTGWSLLNGRPKLAPLIGKPGNEFEKAKKKTKHKVSPGNKKGKRKSANQKWRQASVGGGTPRKQNPGGGAEKGGGNANKTAKKAVQGAKAALIQEMILKVSEDNSRGEQTR